MLVFVQYLKTPFIFLSSHMYFIFVDYNFWTKLWNSGHSASPSHYIFPASLHYFSTMGWNYFWWNKSSLPTTSFEKCTYCGYRKDFNPLCCIYNRRRQEKGGLNQCTLTDLQTLKPIRERIALYYFTLKPTSKCTLTYIFFLVYLNPYVYYT